MAHGKILVVDDDEGVRHTIKMHLGKEGYHTIEAENGEEAIKILREGDNMLNVPLILCDIRMPKVNGVECVEFLRQQAPGIQIVVITGYPDPEMAASLKARGVKEYLVKPIEKEILIQTVNDMVAMGKDFEY